MEEFEFTVDWADGAVRLVDQTRLPAEYVIIDCRTVEELCEAIRSLRVRGAPAIGIAGGFGLTLAARLSAADRPEKLLEDLERAKEALASTRPTAVNLFWALDRVMNAARRAGRDGIEAVRTAVEDEAGAILSEDKDTCRAIGEVGQEIVPRHCTVLTHCNAGGLATGGYGTALAVIYRAAELGKDVRVLVDETRPLLQGARLTAWELHRRKVDTTLICDNMAAAAMAGGRVDLVITGADRIALNGDTANKIGTYGLAVLAGEHGIPFYIAAPVSTIDPATGSGREIPIEERDPDEVKSFGGTATAPREIAAWNPAFDVTPAQYITGIITERGVIRGDLKAGIAAQLGMADRAVGPTGDR